MNMIIKIGHQYWSSYCMFLLVQKIEWCIMLYTEGFSSISSFEVSCKSQLTMLMLFFLPSCDEWLLCISFSLPLLLMMSGCICDFIF